MQKAVIIVAGGSGSRANPVVPKQFIPLAGKPVLFYSLQAFSKTIPEITIILVLPEGHLNTWYDLCEKYKIEIPHITAIGGATRFHSVKNGLKFVNQDSLIAVHDGARPLVTRDLIERAFSVAENNRSAIPCVPVNESLRKIENSFSKPVDRNQYYIIQTPQVFQGDILLNSYQVEYQASFTDDATVVEHSGFLINLIPGDSANMKITCNSDLVIAESFLIKASGKD